MLAEHGGALSPTTIASRARITRQSAWNALARLRKLNVIEDVGQGRGTSYRLSAQHPLVPGLRALIEMEARRVERLFAAVRETAARMKPKPIAVWLYGSVARSEDRPGSDFDLAILSPDGDSSGAEANTRAEAAACATVYMKTLNRHHKKGRPNGAPSRQWIKKL